MSSKLQHPSFRRLCRFLLMISMVTSGLAQSPLFTDQDLEKAFEEAQKQADRIRNIERGLYASGGIISKDTVSPESRHQGKGGTKTSQEMNTVEELFQLATLALKQRKSLTKDQIEKELPRVNLSTYGSSRAKEAYQTCAELLETSPCDENLPYRTIDGSCNNLKHPSWGRANTCSGRLLSANYDDGISEPRKSVTGQPLPNPRDLSTYMHCDLFVNDPEKSLMVMQWGQFLDHDMVLSPMVRTEGSLDILGCCPVGSNSHPACIPIFISENDTFFGPLRKNCLNLVRSSGCSTTCSLGSKNTSNVLTSFIDGSNIYGSSEEELESLMGSQGGRLITQILLNSEFLPSVSVTDNNQCTKQQYQNKCFLAGDERVNEQPGLTSMHTVWLRTHNRLARRLQQLDRKLKNDQIFSITRRIIGGMIQHITYNEFLVMVIGQDYLKKYRLTTRDQGRTFYDPTINPSIVTDFSTAPYRFGHTLIQNDFQEMGSGSVGNLSLKDNFFNHYAVTSGQMPALMAGIAGCPAQAFDNHVVEAVTNHVYQVTGEHSGLDLVAINIQRGRDHGLAPYVDYYLACSNINLTSFDNLTDIMRPECTKKMRRIYKSPRDVDLFTGGLCENSVPGGLVGPTFACIIGQQFQKLKYGDRFYYEHGRGSGTKPFTDDQLSELKNATLAGVICNALKIPHINENAFLTKSQVVDCDTIADINVEPFVKYS